MRRVCSNEIASPKYDTRLVRYGITQLGQKANVGAIKGVGRVEPKEELIVDDVCRDHVGGTDEVPNREPSSLYGDHGTGVDDIPRGRRSHLPTGLSTLVLDSSLPARSARVHLAHELLDGLARSVLAELAAALRSRVHLEHVGNELVKLELSLHKSKWNDHAAPKLEDGDLVLFELETNGSLMGMEKPSQVRDGNHLSIAFVEVDASH